VSDLRAVGVGLQAPVDTVSGQVGSELLLPRWSGLSLMNALEDQLAAPVMLDNNANMAALGELRAGVLQGVSNGCFISVGYGVGAGLILGGELYRGSSGTAGELGHLTLDENGAICTCGNRGCLDTFVGARAITDAVRVSHGDMRYGDVLSLAARGDQGCRRVLADAGQHLGVAVSGLVNLFNPEVIALGGELTRGQEWVLGPMRAALQRHALPSAAATVRLEGSTLGADADLRGCFVAAEHGLPESIEFKS
ncbi:MAG: ROK family protein, partial [Ornithinimicrobium sp.]